MVARSQAIAQAGRVIEGYYEMPMDVEFVLMPGEPTIYLVQARPIVAGQKNPTYIDDAFVSGKKAMQCSKVGVGRAEIAIAASADGIMVYETLAQALNTYLQKKSDERNAIKCVVVQQAPAATSHEATTFRSFNMPVMQHNDVGSVTGWLASQKGQIVVDPQRGLLLATDEQIAPVSGWFESPLPRQLSVGVVGGGYKAVQHLLFHHKVQLEIPNKMLDIFEILKNPGSKDQAKDALCVLLKKLFLRLKQLAGGHLHMHDLDKQGFDRSLFADVGTLLEAKSEMAHALLFSLSLVAQDYLNNIKSLDDNALARNRSLLYPVLFMQTLYNQKVDPQIVAPISLATLLAGVKRDVRAMKIAQDSVTSVAMLDMLKIASDYGFSPEIKDRWARFTNGLSPEVMAELEPQMEILHGLGSMPMFINVIFPSMYKQGDDAVRVVDSIVALMQSNAKSFETLQEMQQKIAGWDVSVFADPAAFTKQWNRFEQELLHYFMDDAFANMFQPLKKNNLVQMTALSVMHKMVDAFDLSIKSLKGSTEYVEVQQKVNNVHTMVVAYWNLFERWVKFLPENIFPVSVDAEYWLRDDWMQDVGKYIEIMGYFKHTGFNMRGLSDLEQSVGFNVVVAAIGSAGRIDEVLDGSYKQRWTLEDYFTLSHQNLLVTLSYLLKYVVDVNDLLLPYSIRDFHDILSGDFTYFVNVDGGEVVLYNYGQAMKVVNFQSSLVGLLINENGVSFYYNVPLRGHSARFVLSYYYKKNDIIAEAYFYRNLARPQVFKRIALYADILDIYLFTKLLSSRIESNLVYLSWDVTKAYVRLFKEALVRMLVLMYPSAQNIYIPDNHWNTIYALKDNLDSETNRKVVLSALDYYSPSYQYLMGLDKGRVVPGNYQELRDAMIFFMNQQDLKRGKDLKR